MSSTAGAQGGVTAAEGGAGGAGPDGTGGGASNTAGTPGTGGGGGGGNNVTSGGNGATSTVSIILNTIGPGGGGGGAGDNTAAEIHGGQGGSFGGGGGGGKIDGAGAPGIIVITYTPAAANSAPTVDSVTLDRTTITPNENTYVWASTTITITDADGCDTITSVTAQFSVASSTAPADGSTCSYNANICYTPTNAQSCVATTTGNTCSDGSPNTGEWDCGFQIWYNAFPTDSSAPIPDHVLQYWYLSATTTDGTDTATATNTAQTVDVATLNALDVTTSITYPETAPNADTGATNQTVTVTNTGNTASDTEISGNWMCTDYPTCALPASRIDEDNQKFGLADDTYASLTNTLSSTTPATIETVLATSTATTTAVTANTFWGIAIPNGQPGGSYTGANTFSAVAD